MRQLVSIPVKAFTKDPNRGNPAMVIDAPLDSEEAMKLVREAPYPVAAIIDTRQDPIPIRFFYENGKTEVFVCGHATLAAAHIAFPPEEKPLRGAFINTNGMMIEIIRFTDGKITQTQSVPEFREVNIPRDELAFVLKVDAILENLPLQLVGSPGKMKLMIPVTFKNLLKIRRDFIAIQTFCARHSRAAEPVTGLFPFALDVKNIDAHARHFPNRDEEDLVCGIGAVALADYLQRYLSSAQQEFVIRCGPGRAGMGDMIVRTEKIEKKKKVYLEGYALSV